jgi:MFS family permease
MSFVTLLTERKWTILFGYFLFISMLAAGYYYNLTFVQLGLVDLGTRVVGMSESSVARNMAMLAGVTCIVALTLGFSMKRLGWATNFSVKLRIVFFVILLQTVLTAIAPFITNPATFTAWVLAASVALGAGVPATFGMATDLIPTHHRGYVAAIITAAAYLPAAVFSTTWRIDRFAEQILPMMIPAVIIFGVLAFAPLTVVRELGKQHRLSQFARGRFVPTGGPDLRLHLTMAIALVLMFGIFFIDSLGFLRIIETPSLMRSAWHATDATTIWIIGGVHVISAVIAGILYTGLNQRALFFWIFGIFALTQMMYVMHARLVPDLDATLAMPILYAVAVSIYTVLNFALWADFSTPETITRNTALGVAISGWLATFISTAISIRWRTEGMTLDQHLSAVAAIAILFMILVLVLSVVQGSERRPSGGKQNTR